MNHLTLSEILEPFAPIVRATMFRKLKVLPNAKGIMFLETLAIYERRSTSLLFFGPGLTFETWEDAKGKRVQGEDTAQTNPLWATSYCIFDEDMHDNVLLDRLIEDAEEAGMAELPRMWIHRKTGTQVHMNDVFRNRETKAGMKVITYGDRHARFLVCPLEFYTEEMEDDPDSLNCGYRKNHDKWAWMTLEKLFNAGYVYIESTSGQLWCMLVADKNQEQGMS